MGSPSMLTPTLLAHATILQIASFVARPAAAYRALELDVNPAFLGAIAASFALLPLIFSMAIGNASDRGRNPQVLLLGSAILLVVGLGLVFLADSIALLVVWMLLLGLGHLMLVIGQQSLIAASSRERLDHSFGLYTFAGSLGQSIGPALIVLADGGRLIPNTTALFVIVLGCAAALLLLTLVMNRGPKPTVVTVEASPRRSLRESVRELAPSARRSVRLAMLISLVAIGCVDLLAIYLPALAVEVGISASAIGLLLSIRGIATMVSRFYLGRLSARIGRNRLVTISTLWSAIFMIALIFQHAVGTLAVILILLGFAIGIGQPLTMTILTMSVPPESRSMWLALRLSANRVGQAALPAGLGMITVFTGTVGVFGLAGVILLAVSGLSWKYLPSEGQRVAAE